MIEIPLLPLRQNISITHASLRYTPLKSDELQSILQEIDLEKLKEGQYKVDQLRNWTTRLGINQPSNKKTLIASLLYRLSNVEN